MDCSQFFTEAIKGALEIIPCPVPTKAGEIAEYPEKP
jgi:hypothetical protein